MVNIKENKGITLVALVVTIIVLLILAGITISMVLGENGIIGRSSEAANQQKIESIKEQIGLEIMAVQAENDGNISDTQLRDILEKYGTIEDDILTIYEGGHKIPISEWQGKNVISKPILVLKSGTITTTLLSTPGTYSLPIALTDNSIIEFSGSGTPSASDLYIIDGVISGNYNLTINGASENVLILSSNNTYTGTTTINNHVQVGNGGTTGVLGSSNVINNGTITYKRSDSINIHNIISGTGKIVKEINNDMTLSGNNSYSGGTIISAGTLYLGNENGLGIGTLYLGDINTNTANITFYGLGYSPSNNIVVNNLGVGNVTIGTDRSGISSFNGTLTVNRDITIRDATGDRTSFGGKISGSGNIIMTGNRRVTLHASNSDFTGMVTIDSGTSLQCNDLSAFSPNARANILGTYIVMDGFTYNVQAGSITGNGTIEKVSWHGDSSVFTFIIGGDNTTDAIFYGKLTDTNVGPLALKKTGTGTQTLATASTYRGGTIIESGTLIVTHANALGTGLVTVKSGATLKTIGVTMPNTVTVETGGNRIAE